MECGAPPYAPSSGGSSIVVNNSIPHSQIQLNTNIQAVAVRVTLHKTIHVCSIYLPPGDRFNIAELEHLIALFPKPFIIMGDFNSHSNVWGCRDTDQKGRIIEDVINRNNLLLYNNKSYTYLHPGTGTYSAIDLTLADASIFLVYSWKVHDDTCGSDHFPIILENSGPELDDKIPRWNLRRAKWDEFKNSCIIKLKSDANDTVDDNITYFSKTLMSIAELSIPKTSSNKKHKSWFNGDCKTAIRSRNQLYENSIYSLALKTSIILKSIEQNLVESLQLPRKHLGGITSINLSPPPSRKKYGT